MKLIPFFCLSLCACVAPEPQQPSVTRVTWSHARPPAATWEQLSQVRTKHRGSATEVSVWGTTYMTQDLRKARGWVQKEDGNLVLCFYAPEPAYGPGEAIPSGAWRTLFQYEVEGLPVGAELRFRERCQPGANNSFKPKPLRGSA